MEIIKVETIGICKAGFINDRSHYNQRNVPNIRYYVQFVVSQDII